MSGSSIYCRTLPKGIPTSLKRNGPRLDSSRISLAICSSSTSCPSGVSRFRQSLVPLIFASSAVGSAFVDNVIFVASFCPVIDQLSLNVQSMPLWWALLFGACFGGNITMIGSTANIVALGMLEKHTGRHMTFFRWLRVGLLSTVLSGAIAVGGILLLERFMPDRFVRIGFDQIEQIIASGRSFKGKNVELVALLAADPRGETREGYSAFTAGAPDRELQRQLATRIEVQIPDALLEKLGADAPRGSRPERKYILRGRLTSFGKGELRLEVTRIVTKPHSQKK